MIELGAGISQSRDRNECVAAWNVRLGTTIRLPLLDLHIDPASFIDIEPQGSEAFEEALLFRMAMYCFSESAVEVIGGARRRRDVSEIDEKPCGAIIGSRVSKFNFSFDLAPDRLTSP